MEGARAILYSGRSVIVDPIGLKPEDFDSFVDLRRLDNAFGKEGIIRMTKEAWLKYESLLIPPEELNKILEK